MIVLRFVAALGRAPGRRKEGEGIYIAGALGGHGALAQAPAAVAPRAVSSPTLLTGLLKCACCGAGMTLATGKGGRYPCHKCNTRIGMGIDCCESDNLPMQELDALVLHSLAGRVFTAARVRLTLEALARLARASGQEQRRQLATLKQERAALTRGAERLYEGIEKGAIKLD